MDSNDQEIFDAAISGEPELNIAPETVEQPTEQNAPARDDQGRFATRQEDVATEQADAPEQPRPGFVPSGRLKEEADARRRAEEHAARLEQMLLRQQPPAQPQSAQQANPLSVWDDPDKWAAERVKSTIDPVMRQMHSVMMHNARLIATSVHGADKIAAAEKAFNDLANQGRIDPADHQRLQSDPNPFDAAVRWHERQSILSEIGNDPKAYEQKIIERYLSSQQQQPATGQSSGGTVVKLPPSLNRSTSAASNGGGGASDLTDAALFAQTTARR